MPKLVPIVVAALAAVGCVTGATGPERDSAAPDEANGGAMPTGTAAGGRPASSAGTHAVGGSGTASGGRVGSAGMSSAGTGATGGGPTPVDPNFKLLWRDEFDGFDGARWFKAEHTFIENLGRFTPDNVVVEGGLLKLKVTNVARGDRPYSAAEVYTSGEFSYGRFEARIKFCKGSGIVSSLFTYKDDAQNQWEEIDIEHLGRLPKAIQYNLISSPAGNGNDRQYQPFVVHFDYSPSEEFHDYAMEWLPDGITFFVDGAYSHRMVQPRIQHATRLRMNAWPTNNQQTNFAGQLDPNAIPCEAQYDWMAAYAYQP